MKYYEAPAERLPVAAETEVLVVGGGPAGFGAALAAGRLGKKVLLLEQSGAVGGVATNGIMSHWTGNHYGGIYEELITRARDCEVPQIINPEKLKLLMLEMLMEAGVTVQLHTFVSGVILEGEQVRGVVTESKSGRQAVYGQILIDSTGDGDVAAKAGVPYDKGRQSDGGMQPVTIMFKVAGVDMDRANVVWGFEDSVTLPEGDLQELAKKHLPAPAGHVLLYPSSLPGVMTCNMTNVTGIDATDVRDLTRGEYECRRQIPVIVDFLRKFVPGYEMCYLIDSANTLGVRETRRFHGLYQLDEKDIAEARCFDDWVVTKCRFFFDLHNVEGAGLDASGQYKAFKQQGYYTIPYRCFVPQKMEGLLLNGRNISGTHLAHSSYRIMPFCVNMGHAMGVAAAKCVELGLQPRQLDVKEIQAVLRTQNVEP